jgi:hypothetical protein
MHATGVFLIVKPRKYAGSYSGINAPESKGIPHYLFKRPSKVAQIMLFVVSSCKVYEAHHVIF